MDLQLVPCERHLNDLDYGSVQGQTSTPRGSGYQTEQVHIFIRAQQKVPECSAVACDLLSKEHHFYLCVCGFQRS